MTMIDAPVPRDQTRLALIEVAAQLLHENGPAAVTTRAVASAAGMQAPTIYRLFGDKDGLLDAVAEHAFATYTSTKSVTTDAADPVDALREGWRTHLDFGLANPAVFALLSDPARVSSPAVLNGLRVLEARVHRIAEAGRLRIPERQAVELIHAAGTGALLSLISTTPAGRDLGLADTMWAAVESAILTDAPAPAENGPAAAAVTLRAAASDLSVLSASERSLLAEWLDRIAGSGPTKPKHPHKVKASGKKR